ncbi:LytR/AlgR family response regulator transcription factor [Mangrovimonas xylaniphaga]|uniref:LytR/AlgR family response regulator transcription factor n=1 Tax=Mangrovimonas xylaniphaga TaxID=1645915 RepID=UPI0006B669D2|nr:LytTR family DNA-binding domain-containing protein [Mangrovimonas xylaniphaga]
MITAVAIDDEPLALKVIETFCEQLDGIQLEKTFSNLTNAKKYINKFPVDVIFLDIEMPNINGIDFYASLTKPVKVIFTTAYDEYAVEGFNLNATDYLLKPFSLERFTEAVSRVQKSLELEQAHENANPLLSIRADYKLHRIPIQDILYLEAMDDYVKIHIQDKKSLVTRSTMKGILEKLPKAQFARIHKSYIVPLHNIKSIASQEVDLGYTKLPIGNSYKQNLEPLN